MGGPKGGGGRGRRVGGGRGGAILRFFPLSQRKFRSFLSLWGSSRGIVAAVQGHDPPKMRFRLVSFCESPDDFIGELHKSNLPRFLRFLETSATPSPKHNWTSTVIKCAILPSFFAPLHLCRLSLHHDSTLSCCGGFCQGYGKTRLDHFEHARLPTQCLVRIISQLQSLQTCDAASWLRAVCNSANAPFSTTRCVRSLRVTQNTDFFLARLSGSFLSLYWLPLAPFHQTRSDRRLHTVMSVLDFQDRSHCADSSPHLRETSDPVPRCCAMPGLLCPMSFLLTPWT